MEDSIDEIDYSELMFNNQGCYAAIVGCLGSCVSGLMLSAGSYILADQRYLPGTILLSLSAFNGYFGIRANYKGYQYSQELRKGLLKLKKKNYKLSTQLREENQQHCESVDLVIQSNKQEDKKLLASYDYTRSKGELRSLTATDRDDLKEQEVPRERIAL